MRGSLWEGMLLRGDFGVGVECRTHGMPDPAPVKRRVPSGSGVLLVQASAFHGNMLRLSCDKKGVSGIRTRALGIRVLMVPLCAVGDCWGTIDEIHSRERAAEILGMGLRSRGS